MRVAVIGVGSLGQHHARIYAALPEAELRAVVDQDGARAGEIATRHGVAALRHHRDLPDDLDAVSVAVPTVHHASITCECLERGLHVLVEKPMAATLAEAERMLELSRHSGRHLLVGHTERFNPAVRATASLVRGPRFIEAHRLGIFTSRSVDVDVVLDVMIHDIDVILSMVPSPVAAVDSVGVNALTEKIDIANARIRFENGCVANVTASRISTDKVRKLRIFQSDSYISLDYATQEALAYRLQRHDGRAPEIVREPISVEQEEPLRSELRAFLARVRGEEAPGVTAEEGVRALNLAFRILAQIGSGPGPRGSADAR